MRIILRFVVVNLKATGLLPILRMVIVLPIDSPIFIIQVQMSPHLALEQTHGHSHTDRPKKTQDREVEGRLDHPPPHYENNRAIQRV